MTRARRTTSTRRRARRGGTAPRTRGSFRTSEPPPRRRSRRIRRTASRGRIRGDQAGPGTDQTGPGTDHPSPDHPSPDPPRWHYLDDAGTWRGPFTLATLRGWRDVLPASLRVFRAAFLRARKGKGKGGGGFGGGASAPGGHALGTFLLGRRSRRERRRERGRGRVVRGRVVRGRVVRGRVRGCSSVGRMRRLRSRHHARVGARGRAGAFRPRRRRRRRAAPSRDRAADRGGDRGGPACDASERTSRRSRRSRRSLRDASLRRRSRASGGNALEDAARRALGGIGSASLVANGLADPAELARAAVAHASRVRDVADPDDDREGGYRNHYLQTATFDRVSGRVVAKGSELASRGRRRRPDSASVFPPSTPRARPRRCTAAGRSGTTRTRPRWRRSSRRRSARGRRGRRRTRRRFGGRAREGGTQAQEIRRVVGGLASVLSGERREREARECW